MFYFRMVEKLWARLFCVAWSCAVFAAPRDVGGFLYIRGASPRVSMDELPSGAAESFRPLTGRIVPSLGKSTALSGEKTFSALLDDGRGRASTGRVFAKDVLFFDLQEDAEAFLERERQHHSWEPSPPLATPASSAGMQSHSGGSTGPSERPARESHVASAELLQSTSLSQAQAQLGGIQQKLRAALGADFVKRVKKDWRPSSEDRIHYLETLEKTLAPKERAFFALVSTAFAEDRQMARSDEKVEDPQGRARMLFTMKIIETRSTSGYARQFMDGEQLSKGDLERMWGVMTQERQFSSWNAGSPNFGNTINAMLGLSDEEQNARDRALAAYRDFSLSKVSFEGFEGQSDGATLMLNRKEVGKITRFMKRKLDYRRNNPRVIVPWTVESIMHNPRFKEGIHQVALRVSEFSIALPKLPGQNEYVRVRAEEIGHWPAYLRNVHSKRMEAARRSQGDWKK